MNNLFAGTLKRLREGKGLSQKQLGQQVFVTHSTIARWENASRLPDAMMIIRLANITGFIWPLEAVEYAKKNRVALAILDIELGTASGLDLCNTLLEINPRTNIVFLTAYPDYSLDAWKTEASGFMLKPLVIDDVREQLKKLRYPFFTGKW